MPAVVMIEAGGAYGLENGELRYAPYGAVMAMEASVGTVAALSVAPVISIVDKAIVSNASGLERLMPSIINSVKVLVKNPITFLRSPSFLLIWGVYSGTYMVANVIKATCERRATDPVLPTLMGSSSANVSLSVLKDKAFARLFGPPGGQPMPLPKASLALFAVRDSMTIFASFTLPDVVQKRTGMSATMAQLIAPCAMQFMSAPLHLLGLDLFNRQGVEVGAAQRTRFVAKEYVSTALARCARILPAFGIGGVLNKSLRAHGKRGLKEMYSR